MKYILLTSSVMVAAVIAIFATDAQSRYDAWWYCSGIQNGLGDYSSPSCPLLRGHDRNFYWGYGNHQWKKN